MVEMKVGMKEERRVEKTGLKMEKRKAEMMVEMKEERKVVKKVDW